MKREGRTPVNTLWALWGKNQDYLPQRHRCELPPTVTSFSGQVVPYPGWLLLAHTASYSEFFQGMFADLLMKADPKYLSGIRALGKAIQSSSAVAQGTPNPVPGLTSGNFHRSLQLLTCCWLLLATMASTLNAFLLMYLESRSKVK